MLHFIGFLLLLAVPVFFISAKVADNEKQWVIGFIMLLLMGSMLYWGVQFLFMR